MFNIMADDVLVMQGGKASSAAMVLTWLPQTIPVPAPVGLSEPGSLVQAGKHFWQLIRTQ